MATLEALMTAVRALRDALHERLDDRISNRVFQALTLRHAKAVGQARREVDDPTLPAESADYDPVIPALAAAATAVTAAPESDERAMLDAIVQAEAALNLVEALP